MDEMIEGIEALIASNEAMTERSPFLEVSRGGLYTARDNAREHVRFTHLQEQLRAMQRLAAREAAAAGPADNK